MTDYRDPDFKHRRPVRFDEDFEYRRPVPITGAAITSDHRQDFSDDVARTAARSEKE